MSCNGLTPPRSGAEVSYGIFCDTPNTAQNLCWVLGPSKWRLGLQLKSHNLATNWLNFSSPLKEKTSGF